MLNRRKLLPQTAALSALLALSAISTLADTVSVTGHTRPFVGNSEDLGPVDAKRTINIRLWIKPQNTAGLDQAVKDRMSRKSSRYHQWLSGSDELQPFRASIIEADQVRKYLTSAGAENVQISPNGTYVTAQVNARAAQAIFQVQLHRFSVGGKEVIANTGDPKLDAAIADKVAYIGGLTTHRKTPYFSRQRDLESGKAIDAQAFPPGGKTGAYETNCFRGAGTYAFSTTGAPAPTPSSLGSPAPDASPSPAPSGGPIQATYTGNRYGSDADAAAPHLPPCGYSPAVVQQVYGFADLHKSGLDGAGQTIVIIDAYGSPTIQADATAFSVASGLPAPDITIYSPAGPAVVGPWNAEQRDWAGETTLDVEWAHVVAPGAKIALVEAASASDDDLAAALAFALENHLGNVVSNSWGSAESQEDTASLALWDILLKTAAAQGVAINFSSGDSGDMVTDGAGGGLGYVDVSYPTSSSLVTGVGGTSLALNSDLSVKFQSGWGSNAVRITDSVASASAAVAKQNAPLDVPTKLGFIGGAGGGTSRVIAKPGFQSGLAGTARMVPDIAFLADPYTGVEVIESAFDKAGNPEPGTLMISVIGGTSLSSPMFSALWSIANQAHGSSLGQAAPLLYRLPSGAINDIVPVSSPDNVVGMITDSKGTNLMNMFSLGLPETMAPFFSALYNSPNTPYRWNVLTFGTDSTLQTAVGWDNVTGLGVPNGVAFVQQFMGSR